jgi:mRNA interferase MazF
MRLLAQTFNQGHIRSVDKTRLVRRLGVLPKATAQTVCDRLQELFQY